MCAGWAEGNRQSKTVFARVRLPRGPRIMAPLRVQEGMSDPAKHSPSPELVHLKVLDSDVHEVYCRDNVEW